MFEKMWLLLSVAIGSFAFHGLADAESTSSAEEDIQRDRVEGFSPLDVFRLQYTDDPQLSPDASRIVYVRRSADITLDRKCSNLWIIAPDGSEHQPLTTGCQRCSSPRWSPDGTRLAYVSNQDGSPQLYVRRMLTGDAAKITELRFGPQAIEWSPDSKQIAFVTLVPSNTPSFAHPLAPPKDAKWAESPQVYDRLIYRFDGAGYLQPGFWHIFIIAADGGTPRQISSGDFQHGGPALRGATEPVWTPDGKYLIASANRSPTEESEPIESNIYEFAIADGAVRALTARQGPDDSPRVSPDGRHIAYTGFDDRRQAYQVAKLYVMDRDGSHSRVLSESLDRDVKNIRWAHDSSGVYFLYDDQGSTRLGFYSLSGRFRSIADHVGRGGGTPEGGGGYSIAKNGTFVIGYTRAMQPVEIAVGKVRRASAARVVTELNRELLAQRKLGEVEEIWYASARDARRIQGWIVRPPEFDPSKKYPLVLEIHGGPAENYGDRFDIAKQVRAAHGYVVLYTNPRGSTGYGEEFGNLIHRAYPGDDFYDLNSGVDAVVAKGYVDAGNLYVTGGSGGGMLTGWMIGRTNRFRAAAMLYPVTDWATFVLTSDAPRLVTDYWFDGLPWDHRDQYERRSLFSVINNVKTPTLVMTGEMDYRAPMSESEQYFRALRLLGVDSVLVRVPDEGHGLGGHPSHQIAKMTYVTDWFDKFRKQQP